MSKLFADCKTEELLSWMHLLDIYFACEGSVNLTAERLFMHKNILRYKLRNLKEITGYDPRRPAGASCLYLAMQFYNGSKR